ncbi:MAG: hypothetical protein HRU38_24795 [Saccharospirillaceae bacterium]|nr:hypothetical protein [Pseudomonadales bacterium]NRB81840.1 hypothetical protein [Saccharospirillaceae bacterium]
MNLKFYAEEVCYSEALDGEIIQLVFQEFPDPDIEIDYTQKDVKLPESIKHITFSANYEFPPYTISVSWYDGVEEDGGELIKKIELTDNVLKLLLENNFNFEVEFQTDDITLKNIEQFLLSENS